MECFFFWFDGCSVDHDASASWAQAIFSVLAILVAVWIPKRDRRDSEISQDEKILECFSLVVKELRFANEKILSQFNNSVANNRLKANPEKIARIYGRATEPLVEALLKTPIIQLPNPQLITFAVEAHKYIRDIQPKIPAGWPSDYVVFDPKLLPDFLTKFEALLVTGEELIEQVRQDINRRSISLF